MRFTTYQKYKGRWLGALNLEGLMEHLSDFLMDGGFAAGPNYCRPSPDGRRGR